MMGQNMFRTKRLSLLGGLCIAGIIALMGLESCHWGGVRVDIEAEAPKLLSQYGFFQGTLADLKPSEGVLPYDLNSPLFTDYAHKARFVWMPAGKAAVYNASETFDFPEGAVLIKNFYYPADFRQPQGKRRIMETRLLVRKEDSWDARTYVWNDDQSDAVFEQAGDMKPVEWIHTDGKVRKVNYTVPNKNQCKGCHIFGKTQLPIGPKARNLNKTYTYSDGAENQLTRWVKLGYLTGAPANPEAAPRLARFDDPSTGTVDQRARAWLEINCAHCHNPKGPGGTSGLNLLADNTDMEAWGICKHPVAAGRGSGNREFDIVPGKPDASILLYRLESNDPGEMMPELGRTVVHEEGVALIREWIASLNGKCD
jgi:uncharacterized repeat protein (TIGR03806 family)